MTERLALADAGPNPDVAIEATYRWQWAVDVLQAEGARVHLAHPSGLKVGGPAGEERTTGTAKSFSGACG